MKAIIKILTALATIAGIVYIIATYGEQIVAWAKKILNSLPKCPACEEADLVEEVVEAPAAAEEAPAPEAPAAEEVPAEDAAPEVVVAEHEPVADDKDFAE